MAARTRTAHGPTETTLLDIVDGPAVRDRQLCLHPTSRTLAEVAPSAPVAIAEAHGALVEDERRNVQLVDDIHRAASAGRNCLVLTRRVAHVVILARMSSARGHNVLVLQCGLRAKALRAVVDRLAEARAGDGLVVIGRTPFIGEGFDVPALETLSSQHPVSFEGVVVRSAGRVVRAAPGKTRAEVHDITMSA